MISSAYREELDEVLAWEWRIDPVLSMPDTSKPPGNRAIRNDVSAVKDSLREINQKLVLLATKDDLKSLEDRVSKVDSEIAALKITRSSRIRRWIWTERNWAIPLISVVLPGIATGLLWVGNLYLDRVIENHTHELTGTISDIRNRLSRIEGRLQIQSAALTARELKSAPVEEIKAQERELQSTRLSLAQIKDRASPEYWPTTVEVLRLASIATSPNPNVVLSLKEANRVRNVSDTHFPPAKWVLGDEVANCTFEGSIIVFKPGVRLHNVTFTNCVFVFPRNASPPTPFIESIGTQLLTAADLSRVTISTG